MNFSEKLKAERKKSKLTQQALADKVGVTLRTIASYESDNRYPRSREIYNKLSEALGVDINYLLTENEDFALQAHQKYGNNGGKQAQALINQIGALYAGGKLDENDMDAVMKSMQKLYWETKEENTKYTPKKYRKEK